MKEGRENQFVVLSGETTRLGGTELEQKLQQLQEAHSVLESRFTRSMKEVADLSDEKQQLEHVVAQLQLETESIGECNVHVSRSFESSVKSEMLEVFIVCNFLGCLLQNFSLFRRLHHHISVPARSDETASSRTRVRACQPPS